MGVQSSKAPKLGCRGDKASERKRQSRTLPRSTARVETVKRLTYPILIAAAAVAGILVWSKSVSPTESLTSRSAVDPKPVGAAATLAARPIARLPDAPTVPASRISGSPPSAPDAALMYDRHPDLYRFATRAADSADRRTLVNGWFAVQDCRAVRADRAVLEQRSKYEGNDSSRGLQASASTKLLERCRGFFDNDISAIRGLTERIVTKLASAEGDALYLPRSDAKAINRDQFARVLETQDWLTFSSALVDVRSRLVQRLGLSQDSAQATVVGVALLQAPCALGRDCSSEGLAHLIDCSLGQQCIPLGDSGARTGLAPQLDQQAAAMRDQIVAAFRRKDAHFFGFHERP